MEDDDEFNEAKLDRFYQLQLNRLNNVCRNLATNTDLAICYQWLKRFEKTSSEDKVARSCLIMLMYEQIEFEGRIGKPFTDMRLCSRTLEEVLAEQDKLFEKNQNMFIRSGDEYDTMHSTSTIYERGRASGGANIYTKRRMVDKKAVKTMTHLADMQYQAEQLVDPLKSRHTVIPRDRSLTKQPLRNVSPSRNFSSQLKHATMPRHEDPFYTNYAPEKRLPPILKPPTKWSQVEIEESRKRPQIHDMQKIWINLSQRSSSPLVVKAKTPKTPVQHKDTTSATKKDLPMQQSPRPNMRWSGGKYEYVASQQKTPSQLRSKMQYAPSEHSLKTFDSHKIYWRFANRCGRLPLCKPRTTKRPLDRQVGGASLEPEVKKDIKTKYDVKNLLDHVVRDCTSINGSDMDDDDKAFQRLTEKENKKSPHVDCKLHKKIGNFFNSAYGTYNIGTDYSKHSQEKKETVIHKKNIHAFDNQLSKKPITDLGSMCSPYKNDDDYSKQSQEKKETVIHKKNIHAFDNQLPKKPITDLGSISNPYKNNDKPAKKDNMRTTYKLHGKDIIELGSLYSQYMNKPLKSCDNNVIDMTERPKKSEHYKSARKPHCNCTCTCNARTHVENADVKSKNPPNFHELHHQHHQKLALSKKLCELCLLINDNIKLEKDVKKVNMELMARREVKKIVDEESRKKEKVHQSKLEKKLLHNAHRATHNLKHWKGKENLDFFSTIFKVFKTDEEFMSQLMESDKKFSDLLKKILNYNIKVNEKRFRNKFHQAAKEKFEKRKQRAEQKLKMQVAVEQQHHQLRQLSYLAVLKRLYLNECLGKIKVSKKVLKYLDDEYENYSRKIV